MNRAQQLKAVCEADSLADVYVTYEIREPSGKMKTDNIRISRSGFASWKAKMQNAHGDSAFKVVATKVVEAVHEAKNLPLIYATAGMVGCPKCKNRYDYLDHSTGDWTELDGTIHTCCPKCKTEIAVPQ